MAIKVWIWPNYKYVTEDDNWDYKDYMFGTSSDDYIIRWFTEPEFEEFEQDPKFWYTIHIDQNSALDN